MKFKILYTESDLNEDGEIFEFICDAENFSRAVDLIPADNPGIIDWEFVVDNP
jgi:hypothetical protein